MAMHVATYKSLPNSLFYLLCFIILSFFLKKIEIFSGAPFNAVANAAFFLICGLVIYDKVQVTGRINHGGWPAYFLVCYLFVSLINSVYQKVEVGALVYQFIVETKPLAIYLAVVNSRNLSFEMSKLYRASILIGVLSIFLFLFRLAAPSAYDLIFSAGGHGAKFHTYDGSDGLWRAVGIFWHPGQLSFYCLWIVGVLFLYSREPKFINNRKKMTYFLITVFCFMLAVSLRRADLMTLPMAIYGSIWLTRRNRVKQVLSIFLLFGVISVFFVGINDYLGRASEHYSFFNPEDSVSPRVVYTYKAVGIANDYFPLGSGWGTFASHASAAFGSDLEKNVGLSHYWWYEADQAGYDAFWAHVIAETGYLGMFLYIAFLVSLLFKSIFAEISLNIKRLRVFSVLILIASTLTSSAIFSIYYLTAIFLVLCLSDQSLKIDKSKLL